MTIGARLWPANVLPAHWQRPNCDASPCGGMIKPFLFSRRAYNWYLIVSCDLCNQTLVLHIGPAVGSTAKGWRIRLRVTSARSPALLQPLCSQLLIALRKSVISLYAGMRLEYCNLRGDVRGVVGSWRVLLKAA